MVDDVDDGPGLGCTSPEHESIIASHVSKTMPIKIPIITNEDLAFARNVLPWIIVLQSLCIHNSYAKCSVFSIDISVENARISF